MINNWIKYKNGEKDNRSNMNKLTIKTITRNEDKNNL